ncbi:hypothetical protein KXW63_004420 [Aspergillus fumigatus]|nr:hypothetical protein KXW63_004420 [Aspergillus fumigatus]
MRFAGIAVGVASVLGHLATPSSAKELAARSPAAANSCLVKEGLFAYESILAALGNTGINAPGTAAGLLIASPTIQNPDYFYTWTRDAALTFKGLVDIFIGGDTFIVVNLDGLETHIQDYISSQAVLQNVSNPSGRLSDGSGLGEPKFEVNFNPYSGGWGRPQRDGPALRAITMLTYIRQLIQQGKQSVASNLIWPVVANDLTYVAQYWNHTGFDLWEEIDGSSFFTTAVQHRAMVEGSAIAQALGKPHAGYDAVAPEILCLLQSYWNESAIISNINVNNGRSGIDLNSVLTSIHTFDPAAGCDDSTFQPCSSKALANHKVYVDSFRSIYGINAGLGPGKAANVGRYAEDVYQGGNPWYLATLAAAEQLYDALYQWKKQGYLTVTQTSLAFFRDFSSTVEPGTYKSNTPTYKSLTDYVRTYADDFFFLVEKYTPSNGSLAEQYDRNTGVPLSANDLTWSYAAFLSTLQRRLNIMPDSWGPSSANPVPTTCSKTTITGTYSAVAPPFPTSTAQCVAAVTVPVTFWLIENTYYGENVYMTGNVSALGDWNASAGYSLNAGLYTSDENLWFATVKGLEPGVTMEYKFYKIEPGNSVTFEGGENRVYAVPTASGKLKAVIYTGNNKFSVEDRPIPVILEPTDAIVKVLHTTICGTDLHILQGHVATCTPGRILGHEGVGVIDSLGAAVTNFKAGQTVLISCITSCGTCHDCRRKMPSQCESGGWILGNKIDGTQAEYVRIPHASFSLHALPEGIDPEVAVTLSDTVPTSYECGILNGDIQPGATVAIIGTGPIGLMILQMAKNLFGPAMTVVVGRGQPRLEIANAMGADHTLSVLGGQDEVISAALAVTKERGFDVVIEAVGTVESFAIAQALVGAGGTLASLGVFGESCELRLEKLWHRNICLRTRLVDGVSTPDLLKMVEAGGIDPRFLVSHSIIVLPVGLIPLITVSGFTFDEIHNAYEAFEASSKHGALKVVVTLPEPTMNGLA